ESVATYLDLRTDPMVGANAINVLLPKSGGDITKIVERLRQIPEDDKVITIADLIPEGQERKLTLIHGLARQLQTALGTEVAGNPPPDGQNVCAAESTS